MGGGRHPWTWDLAKGSRGLVGFAVAHFLPLLRSGFA